MLGKPTGKQAASIVHSTGRLNIWDGSVSSGKTVASILRWLDFADSGPPGDLMMLGKTERSLKRNVLDQIAELIGSDLSVSSGRGEARIFGRRIYLGGANDERSEQKIRGVTLVGAYGDEISTWPESVFKMLLSRLRLAGASLFGTTNPDSPMHWLKREFLDRADELGIRRFHINIDDNPHLEPSYVESIKREYTGLWYKRFIEGAWVAAEGAIYDMLDLDVHVVDELPKQIAAWLLWIDHGTANPLHALLAAVAEDGLYVAREWRWDSREKHRQLTDAEYSQRLRAWLQGGADGAYLVSGKAAPVPLKEVVLDPSAIAFREQLQRDGWGWATQADNSVLDGIRDTASLLSAGRLHFHRSTENVQRELSSYVWDPKAQERGQDAPLKVDDHGCDALRYGIRSGRRYWRGWLRSIHKEAA